MAPLTPRRIDLDRLQRLDELVRLAALPALGFAEVTLPADHPLRVARCRLARSPERCRC